jgi:cyclic pyranopterin phosphate synthase
MPFSASTSGTREGNTDEKGSANRGRCSKPEEIKHLAGEMTFEKESLVVGDSKPDVETLTHLDETGEVHMVDVGGKPVTHRTATATALLAVDPKTVDLIQSDSISKGNVGTVAKIAGIMAAKRTSELIPLCHPVPLTSIDISFSIAGNRHIRLEATARTDGKTGVEMEALTAVSVAALTVYDMCKSVDRGMTIVEIGLLEKSGGKTGTWTRS